MLGRRIQQGKSEVSGGTTSPFPVMTFQAVDDALITWLKCGCCVVRQENKLCCFIHGCAGQLSTNSSTFLPCWCITRANFWSHEINISLDIRALELAS